MKADIARHEPATCLAPGLFCSVKKGERPKLDVKYQHGSVTLEFKGVDQLGVDDLRVLQGLVSLAGREKIGLIRIGPQPKTEDGLGLRAGLCIEGDESSTLAAIAVKCSWKTLADEIGLAWGGSRMKALRQCVERMAVVSIFRELGGRRTKYQLISEYDSDSASLCVGLNPAIASAITGGRFVLIDMNEVRSLASDPARLVHQRLCAFIDPSKACNATLETLSGYVWGSPAENGNLAKYRRKTILKALAELKGLGWHVVEIKTGVFRIQRP